MTKRCGNCGVLQDISFYNKRKDSSDGFYNTCKSCILRQAKERADRKAEKDNHPEGTKRCRDCKEIKPVTSFTPDKFTKDGTRNRCNTCLSAIRRSRTKKRLESTNANENQWQKDNPGKKKCTGCGEAKPISNFHTNKRSRDGRAWKCKQCFSLASGIWKKSHKAQINKSARLRYDRDKKDPNKPTRVHKKNPDKSKEDSRKHRKLHPEYCKNYSRKRRETDIWFRLSSVLRGRVKKVLKNRSKIGSAVQDLGCNGEQLIQHLESLWTEGMSWENYGCKDDQWSMDHIMPLSQFNLEDRQHFLLAAHYLNLRPLWHLENVRKSDSIPYELLQAG